ncbi:hypothetical protein [Mameliella sp.]|uniref:hypothetical protein n=1 Tax=Mameliella sp. TaxID=1924940 RepID=UPI003B51059E
MSTFDEDLFLKGLDHPHQVEQMRRHAGGVQQVGGKDEQGDENEPHVGSPLSSLGSW